MKILQFEDDSFKQFDISRQLPRDEIECVTNLADGLAKIPGDYDLIITDMWYQKYEGSGDHDSGRELIEYLKEHEIQIPVILVSSMDYRYEIFGNVHYDKEKDWETDFVKLVNKRRQQL